MAILLVAAYVLTRLPGEDIDGASRRLGRAVRYHETSEIYGFIGDDEKQVLGLSQESVAALLKKSIFSMLPKDGTVTEEIRPEGAVRYVLLQNPNDRRGFIVSIDVVGTPGKFRIPSFVELCVQLASNYESPPGQTAQVSPRIEAEIAYLKKHTEELKSFGLKGTYDSESKAMSSFEASLARLEARIAEVLAKRQRQASPSNAAGRR